MTETRQEYLEVQRQPEELFTLPTVRQMNMQTDPQHREAAHPGEDVLHSILRNTVLLEIDEADILEAIHDLLRCTPLLTIRTCLKELAEVDEREVERRSRIIVADQDNRYRL